MDAQAGSAVVEMALLEPTKVQQTNNSTSKATTPENEDGDFQLFGQDGLTFWDVLDIVNPLQHIPVVSTIYRAITGDEIDPAAKLAGGSLYGGPIGAITSAIDVAVDIGTGKDIGEHALAWVKEKPVDTQIAENKNLGNEATANFLRSSYAHGVAHNPYLARAQSTNAPITFPTNTQTSILLAQEINNSEISGIPTPKLSYADQIKNYLPKTPSASPAPDLGMLGDIQIHEKFGHIESEISANPNPIDLAPKFSASNLKNTSELNSRLNQAETAYQKLSANQNEWLLNSIFEGMTGLDGLKNTSDGNRQVTANLY